MLAEMIKILSFPSGQLIMAALAFLVVTVGMALARHFGITMADYRALVKGAKEIKDDVTGLADAAQVVAGKSRKTLTQAVDILSEVKDFENDKDVKKHIIKKLTGLKK